MDDERFTQKDSTLNIYSPYLYFPSVPVEQSLRCPYIDSPDISAFFNPPTKVQQKAEFSAKQFFAKIHGKINLVANKNVAFPTPSTGVVDLLNNPNSNEALLDTNVQIAPSSKVVDPIINLFDDLNVSESSQPVSYSKKTSLGNLFSPVETTPQLPEKNIEKKTQLPSTQLFPSNVVLSPPPTSAQILHTPSNPNSKPAGMGLGIGEPLDRVLDQPVSVTIGLHTMDDLLCIHRGGTLEKFDINCTAHVSVSGQGGGAADANYDVIIAARNNTSYVDSAACLVGPRASLVLNSGEYCQYKVCLIPPHGPEVLTPLLKCKVNTANLHPYLCRVSSSVMKRDPPPAAAPSGDGLAVPGASTATSPSLGLVALLIVRVNLNPKMDHLLEGVTVVVSLSQFAECSVTAVRNKPASGVYNPASKTVMWSCGDCLASKQPLLQVESLVTYSADSPLPTSLPVIVKARLGKSLVPESEYSIVSCSSAEGGGEVANKTRNVTQKSKVEYRFL